MRTKKGDKAFLTGLVILVFGWLTLAGAGFALAEWLGWTVLGVGAVGFGLVVMLAAAAIDS